MVDCANIQRLLRRFRRAQEDTVLRASDGTADYSEEQRALKQTVEHITAECKKNQTRYTDDEFPDHSNEHPNILRKVSRWLRIEDVSPRASDGRTKWKMFDDPKPSDVAQGGIGNCWLVGAISIIADKPHLLRRIFVTQKYNKYGVYGVQLYIDGVWRYVIVDDRFPCNDYGELVFAWGRKMQLWVPLLEKAIAKLFGSYGALDGGLITVGTKFLTGAPVTFFSCESYFSSEENRKAAFDAIRYALRDQCLVCTNSGKATDELASVGIEHEHVYTILDTKVVADQRLLFLRNIWGTKAFTGRWGPDSDYWQAVIDRDSLPENLGSASKGMFWISLEDVAQYFSTLVICYARENYHQYHIKAKIQQSGDAVWETFEVEVLEETCLDINFGKFDGARAELKKAAQAEAPMLGPGLVLT
ncbi:calpain-15-like [Watersipora subatra]|uniref:calpain-15-like n=1 Tax=Watersipora subatra TaxID=2589382 RepID=UPI00355B9099